MSIALITGSAGLIGAEATKHFAAKGMDVIGIDNNMRSYFFGKDASTVWMRESLEKLPTYTHSDVDIRNRDGLFNLFGKYGSNIELVIHTAAQPSHDWAAKEPFTDFDVNAVGTVNMLESVRQFCPSATFIFTSTNKVYGDTPNRLPLIEEETRWNIDPQHAYKNGIDEHMSIDSSTHSVFGASKVAADIMVQEYGRYFGIKTGVFRGGCLTGPGHSGAQLHGFLAYLVKCCANGTPYKVFGYKGKQVRDNIHSSDLIAAFDAFQFKPRIGEVYNIGGSQFSNCSMLEAIAISETICKRKLTWDYVETNRTGDHIWWISDISKFKAHYPAFTLKYNVPAIIQQIFEANQERWLASPVTVA